MLGLIIFGTGNNAEMAYDYFRYERSLDINGSRKDPYYPYSVWMTKQYWPIAFTKDNPRPDETFCDLPVIPFDKIELFYPPDKYEMFISVGYKDLNHLRARKYEEAKKKGYKFASFISTHSYIGRNVEIGENVMIMEENNIQYGAKIGNNVIMWSGSHVGHGAVLEDHIFMASHVIVAGFCKIGSYSFIGGGVIFAENVEVGADSLVGAGAYLARSIHGNKAYVTRPSFEERDFAELSEKAQAIYAPK